VQEVLAEGEYRIGFYYYVKGDRRAAAARLIAVTNRYPLFSRADKALWMLGDIFEKSERKDIAAAYYGLIVRNYPKSGMATVAKNKLVAFNVPVPQPDPKAVALMTANQNTPRPRESLVKRPMALFKSGPGNELRAASTVGTPNMKPEADNTSATDVLTGGGKPQLGGGGSGSGTGIVATVVVGGNSSEGTTSGAENTTASPDGSSPNPPASNDANGPATTGTGPASNDAPAAAGTSTSDTAATTTNAPATDAAAPASDTAAKTDGAQSADSAKTDGTQSGTTASTPAADGKESSSKKKKGLRKIIPW
jgi:hypothetical protein